MDSKQIEASECLLESAIGHNVRLRFEREPHSCCSNVYKFMEDAVLGNIFLAIFFKIWLSYSIPLLIDLAFFVSAIQDSHNCVLFFTERDKICCVGLSYHYFQQSWFYVSTFKLDRTWMIMYKP